VLDVRPKQYSDEQVATAVEALAKRAGPVASLVRRRTEETWQTVRADLNAVAGGQASARAMVLAHHAMRAHQALELQSLFAEVAFGEEQELADKHMRNQAGLAIVATDALNKAYEAAREDAKASSNPVTGLMSRLGQTAPMGQGIPGAGVGVSAEAPEVSPFSMGGGIDSGSLPLKTQPISHESSLPFRRVDEAKGTR
jgi:hypothetical protein